MKKKSLTPKQEKFCLEYLVDLNATQAAIRAGYSKKTANRIGPQNLSKIEIRKVLEKKINQQKKQTGVTISRVVDELAKIAFGDVKKIFHHNGKLKSVSALERDVAAMVASVNVSKTSSGEETLRIKLHDKLKALELLGRHLGMFTERIEHSGSAGQVVIVMPDNGRSGGIRVVDGATNGDLSPE